jgi:RNA polymerase sigma-70 factor, ECF subfamily
MDDTVLIQASQNGDREAFGHLVDHYYQKVYKLAHRYTGSHTEADDICQETFLRAFAHLDRLRKETCFQGWILMIAINLSRQTLRRRKGLRQMNPTQLDEISDLAVEKVTRPFEALSVQERAQIIHQQLQAMPDHLRLVTLLILMEGLSQKDTAVILDYSESSVSRHLASARRWLRGRLKNLI